jgi:hypothetical protein
MRIYQSTPTAYLKDLSELVSSAAPTLHRTVMRTLWNLFPIISRIVFLPYVLIKNTWNEIIDKS